MVWTEMPRAAVTAFGTVQSHWRPTRRWGVDPGSKQAIWLQVEDDGDYLYQPDFKEANRLHHRFWPTPAGLPPVGGGFVGRDRELDRVGVSLLTPARPVTLIEPRGDQQDGAGRRGRGSVTPGSTYTGVRGAPGPLAQTIECNSGHRRGHGSGTRRRVRWCLGVEWHDTTAIAPGCR